MLKSKKSPLIHWLLLSTYILVIITVTFATSEMLYRKLLFSDLPFMQPLRNPRLYTSGISSDYFRLQHIFNKTCAQPKDSTVGWVNQNLFSSPGYLHREESFVGSRVPLLLYGDSFAQCVTSEEDCFQGILNHDIVFRKDYFLLNFGVIGYGLDQTYLLYQKTIENFDSPIVIISLLDRDMERCMSGSTWGLKPFLKVDQNGHLRYHGEHLKNGVEDFFQENPPQIWSYLYRLMIFSPIVPEPISDWLGSVKEQQNKLKELNEAIILRLANDLKSRKIRHIFLVFEWAENIAEPPGWRIQFLVNLFQQNQIDFILARDIIKSHEKGDGFDWHNYALSSEWNHPNPKYNKLISACILNWILHDQPRKTILDPK